MICLQSAALRQRFSSCGLDITGSLEVKGSFDNTDRVSRRDWLVSLCALVLLALWDSTGWDLSVMRWLGTTYGFVWRDATGLVWLYSASRAAGWAALAWMAWMAFSGARRDTLNVPYWLGITVLCLLVVTVLRYASTTSCPWDLAEFGGTARYISHWRFLMRDGGTGSCFPSGHASTAFAFFNCYFMFRPSEPKHARRVLVMVCAAGLIVSLTQIARGAHYPSHTLWTGWWCWTLACAANTVLRLKH